MRYGAASSLVCTWGAPSSCCKVAKSASLMAVLLVQIPQGLGRRHTGALAKGNQKSGFMPVTHDGIELGLGVVFALANPDHRLRRDQITRQGDFVTVPFGFIEQR